MAEFSQWPAWHYGPKGEAQVFDAAGDVPAGWKDHPSKVGEKSPEPAKEAKAPKAKAAAPAKEATTPAPEKALDL